MNRAAAAVGLAVAACAAPAPPTAPAVATPTAVVTPLLASAPLVEEIGVTCGDGAVFGAGLLDDVAQAHLGEDSAAVALRQFLGSADGTASGATSWVRVELTGSHAQFLGRQADDRWSFVRFVRRAGAWALDVHGQCVPTVAIEAGQLAVEWSLDGTTRERTEGRTLGLLLDTVPCDPGDPVLEHVEAPLVTMREDRIEVVVLAREDRAAAYCRGPFPLAIDLPEPDTDRPVYDGATFPPRLVERR